MSAGFAPVPPVHLPAAGHLYHLKPLLKDKCVCAKVAATKRRNRNFNEHGWPARFANYPIPINIAVEKPQS